MKDDLQNAGIAVHQASHLFDQGMSSEVILLLHMVLNIPFSAFLTVSENSEIKKIIESKALANGFLNSFKSLQLNVTDLHNSVLAKGKRKSKSQHIYQEQAFDMRCCIRELGWYEKVLGKKNSDPNVKLFRQLTNGWTQEQIDEVLDRELLITVVPSYVHQQERKELHASLWETCAGITLIKGKLTKPTKAELKLLKPVYLSEVTKIDYQSIQYLGAEEIYEKARTLETTTDGGLKHKLMLELFEESYEGRVHDQKKQIKLKSRIQQMEQSTEHVSDADKIKAINEMLASFEPERANDPLMFYIVDYEQLDQHYDNELFKTIISTESRGLSAIERYDNPCLIEPVNMRLKRIGGKSLMCSTMSTIMVRFMAVLLAATFQLQVLAINKDLCKVKNKNKTDNLYILDFNTWFETINQQFFLVDYQNRSISHNGLSEKFTENLQKVDVKTPEYINYGRVYEKLWSDREYNPNRPNYVEKM